METSLHENAFEAVNTYPWKNMLQAYLAWTRYICVTEGYTFDSSNLDEKDVPSKLDEDELLQFILEKHVNIIFEDVVVLGRRIIRPFFLLKGGKAKYLAPLLKEGFSLCKFHLELAQMENEINPNGFGYSRLYSGIPSPLII